MSFWKNLFGASKKETQIMEEPEHELRVAPPDDLMIVKKDEEESNISEDKKDKVNGEAREGGLGQDLDNKDSS